MKANEVRRILGVTQRTLNTYIREGKLHPHVVNSHHYEYDRDEVYAIVKTPKKRVNVTYARVSLPKQKNDLATQNERLYDYALRNGFSIAEQIQDVKSGIAFNERKGFCRLLYLVTTEQVDTVIIEHKDRLTRFAYELLENVFKAHGTNIVAMSEAENKSYEQELTDDLISIIHYYSMKSYSNKRRLHNAENALKNKEE